MPLDVVIPAGGSVSEAYAGRIGTPFRALAPFGPDAQPLMQIVVDALRESGGIGRIIGVAPPEVVAAIQNVDQWLPAGPSGAANILRGLAAVPPDAPALVCLSDLPLIQPEHIQGFLAGCDWEAEANLGLIRGPAFEQAFPDAPPSTFVKLRDEGPVTLSGLFAVHPRLLQRQAPVFEALFGARKSQWQTARILGPRLLWDWATRRISLVSLLALAQTRFDSRVHILHDVAPVLAFDVDTADDYTYANTRFEASHAPAA